RHSPALDSGARAGTVSPPGRTRPPSAQPAVGRRAADAGAWPGVGGQSAAAGAGRTHRRPRAPRARRTLVVAGYAPRGGADKPAPRQICRTPVAPGRPPCHARTRPGRLERRFRRAGRRSRDVGTLSGGVARTAAPGDSGQARDARRRIRVGGPDAAVLRRCGRASVSDTLRESDTWQSCFGVLKNRTPYRSDYALPA